VIAGVYNSRRQDYVWLSITAIPLFSADEASPREVFVTLHDITERKLMEKYQQNFYNVLNTSRNELYIFDADTLHFEFVSAGALGNLGYTLDEMRGMTPLDLKPDFTPTAFDKVISPLRHHQTQVITFETRHRRANGSFYPVEVHLQLFDQSDHHVFMAVILDITERRQAQEQLQLQAAMLEASANAIVITDNKGNIQWANPAFTTLTGFSTVEDTLGKNPRNLIKSGMQDEAFYTNMWETILAGRVWHGELVNRRKDGTFYDYKP
jgi:PAS domain S-box-containing protein